LAPAGIDTAAVAVDGRHQQDKLLQQGMGLVVQQDTVLVDVAGERNTVTVLRDTVVLAEEPHRNHTEEERFCAPFSQKTQKKQHCHEQSNRRTRIMDMPTIVVLAAL